MTTTNYGISDADGNQITVGLSELVYERVAQRMANERGVSVFAWSMPEGDNEAGENEEFSPDGEGYEAEADDAEPSTCSDSAGAMDVEVTLTLPSGKTITSGCTLWPHADGRPGYGTSGTPLDGWMGGDLCAAVRKMHDKAREAAIDAVRDAAAEACSKAAS